MLRPDEKPEVSYADIGGMDMQKQEVREAVELPLTHGELYQQVTVTLNVRLLTAQLRSVSILLVAC